MKGGVIGGFILLDSQFYLGIDMCHSHLLFPICDLLFFYLVILLFFVEVELSSTKWGNGVGRLLDQEKGG